MARPALGLWQDMTQRLQYQGTSISDIVDCSSVVLGELLGELGFTALQKAKLQTEWSKRTSTALIEEDNIQIMQSLVPDNYKVLRVDRMENEYLQEQFMNNVRASGLTAVGLWYQPSFNDDSICVARVGFSSSGLEPIRFSDIPPSGSNRFLYCDVCSYDPYNVINCQEAIPRLLVTVREVGGRLSPPPVRPHSPEIIESRLTHGIISPSLVPTDGPIRSRSPIAGVAAADAEAMRLQRDLMSLPQHMRVEPSLMMPSIPPPISSSVPTNHTAYDRAAAKEQTRRLLSETDRLMAELHKPLVYSETNPPIGWMQAQQAMEEAEEIARRKQREEDMERRKREEEEEKAKKQQQNQEQQQQQQQQQEEEEKQPEPVEHRNEQQQHRSADIHPSAGVNNNKYNGNNDNNNEGGNHTFNALMNVPDDPPPPRGSIVAALGRELGGNQRSSSSGGVATATNTATNTARNTARNTQELRQETRSSGNFPMPSRTNSSITKDNRNSTPSGELSAADQRKSAISTSSNDGVGAMRLSRNSVNSVKQSTVDEDRATNRMSMASGSGVGVGVAKDNETSENEQLVNSRNSLSYQIKDTQSRNSTATSEALAERTSASDVEQIRNSVGLTEESNELTTGEVNATQRSSLISGIRDSNQPAVRNSEDLRSSLASGIAKDDKRHSVHIGPVTSAEVPLEVNDSIGGDHIPDPGTDRNSQTLTTARSSLVGTSIRKGSQVRVSLPETAFSDADASINTTNDDNNIPPDGSNPSNIINANDVQQTEPLTMGSIVESDQLQKLQVVDDPNAGTNIRFSTLQPASRTASVCTDERGEMNRQLSDISLKRTIIVNETNQPVDSIEAVPPTTAPVAVPTTPPETVVGSNPNPDPVDKVPSNTSNAEHSSNNIYDASQQTLPMAPPAAATIAPRSLNSTASSTSVVIARHQIQGGKEGSEVTTSAPPNNTNNEIVLSDNNNSNDINISQKREPAAPTPVVVSNRVRKDSITSAFRDGADDIRRHLENEDVVQVAVSEPSRLLPRPPSPTPKLNPIAIKEDAEETVLEKAEETRKQEVDDWEVRVKEALSRVSTISSGMGKKSQQEKESLGATVRQRAKLSSVSGTSSRLKTPASPISVNHPTYGLPNSEPNTSRVISPEREGSLAMAGRFRAEQAADLTLNLLGNNLRDWVNKPEVSSALQSGQLPSLGPVGGGIESFEDTLHKIELSAKTDFDAVTNKLEALKGKMDATRQSWMSVRPQHSGKARWVGADLPGGLWGPAFTQLQDEYARALETTVDRM